MDGQKTADSLCPVCMKRVKARYVRDAGNVCFTKECPGHGVFTTPVSKDEELFLRWMAVPDHPVPPKRPLTGHENGCPFDCGTCERHLQTACCVVLELTARCNMCCRVCYASSGDAVSEEPSMETIKDWYDFLWDLGEERPFNLQLSGGEPTMRDDLPEIIQMAAKKGFPYIQLNTNGLRLAREPGYARRLKDAGLSVVFLQFDSTDDRINMLIRGQSLLAVKEQAISSCREAGIPVALVPVIFPGMNEGEIGRLIRYAADRCDIVKGIHFQPAAYMGRYPEHGGERCTMFDIMEDIERQTEGAIRRQDMHPLSSGHSLCSFYSTFLVNGDNTFTCTSRPGQGDCCGKIDPVAKDRDFVKDKWRVEPEGDSCCDGLDAFIHDFRKRSLTVTAMQFQDVWNLDLDRVRRCRVQVLSADKKLVPFCAYNLTDASGNYLYRPVH
ncbi:radical SAM (seleno)protein TrsS [Enterocloster bolteae]|uniref:radical SAM (seleno)protein TrsS n=1 Tax=Enterocloster bolteae TaxID=208479 RepID=UPI002A836070|nr:radical SAM (seleno)protein TrsS [Enterocloster bolteae]